MAFFFTVETVLAHYFLSLFRFPTKNILFSIPLGQALSRSYGRFFAEFLGDLSLVRLGLLDLTTCVGLRYGFHIHNFRRFSWKLALCNLLVLLPTFSLCLEFSFKRRSGFS